MKNLTTEQFIEKAKSRHGVKYQYQLVDYINNTTPVKIICNIHGQFEQKPFHHLTNGGCRKCKSQKQSLRCIITNKDFIESCIKTHGNKYSYEDCVYTGAGNKVIIICPEHGKFSQNAYTHKTGTKCPSCNDFSSRAERDWIDTFSIPENLRNICITINGESFNIDGYDKRTKTIYEFYGDFWHGNPNAFNKDDINPLTKTSYKSLYENTMAREQRIKDGGYNLVTIWESDWNRLNRSIVDSGDT